MRREERVTVQGPVKKQQTECHAGGHVRHEVPPPPRTAEVCAGGLGGVRGRIILPTIEGRCFGAELQVSPRRCCHFHTSPS